MNQKFKKLIDKLQDNLQDMTLSFLYKHLEDEENTSDVLNIILSSHLSSCFTLMSQVSKEHPKIYEEVEEFIKNINKAISEQSQIMSVEINIE